MPRSSTPSAKATWAVSSLVKETPEVIQRFVHHYQQAGADEILLFFDNPEDPSFDWAREQDRVHCFRCTEEHIRELGGPFLLMDDYQVANFSWALHHHGRCEWMLNVDADEHLTGHDEIGNYLAQFNEDVATVRFLPLEAIWSEHQEPSGFTFDYARLKYSWFWPWSRTLCRRVYGDAAYFLNGGISGHSIGKTAIRVSCWQSIKLGLHVADAPAPLSNVIASAHHMGLLHYDVLSYEHFLRKIGNRADATEDLAPNFFRRKYFEHFSQLYRQKDEQALRRFFHNLYVLSDHQLALLEARHLVVTIDAATSRITSPRLQACEIRDRDVGDTEMLCATGYQTAVLETREDGSLAAAEFTPTEGQKDSIVLPQEEALARLKINGQAPDLIKVDTGDSTPNYWQQLKEHDVLPRFLQTKIRHLDELETLHRFGFQSFILFKIQHLQKHTASTRGLRLDTEYFWHHYHPGTLGPVGLISEGNWQSFDKTAAQWKTLMQGDKAKDYAIHASLLAPDLLSAPLNTRPRHGKKPPLFPKLRRPPVAVFHGTRGGQAIHQFKQAFPWARLFALEPDERAYQQFVSEAKPYKRVQSLNLGLAGSTQGEPPSEKKLPTLDTFRQEKKLEFIDYLALLALGDPLPLLHGATRSLQEKRLGSVTLQLELQDEETGRQQLAEAWQFLEQHGFNLHHLSSRNAELDTNQTVEGLVVEFIHQDYPKIRPAQGK